MHRDHHDNNDDWAGCSTIRYRRAKSTGLPSRILGFLTHSTGLLGGRTFLLVLKKKHKFGILIFFLILIFFWCGFTVW